MSSDHVSASDMLKLARRKRCEISPSKVKRTGKRKLHRTPNIRFPEDITESLHTPRDSHHYAMSEFKSFTPESLCDGFGNIVASSVSPPKKEVVNTFRLKHKIRKPTAYAFENGPEEGDIEEVEESNSSEDEKLQGREGVELDGSTGLQLSTKGAITPAPSVGVENDVSPLTTTNTMNPTLMLTNLQRARADRDSTRNNSPRKISPYPHDSASKLMKTRNLVRGGLGAQLQKALNLYRSRKTFDKHLRHQASSSDECSPGSICVRFITQFHAYGLRVALCSFGGTREKIDEEVKVQVIFPSGLDVKGLQKLQLVMIHAPWQLGIRKSSNNHGHW
eukprot:m.149771 g.149771  ORF g.149771 m.149771 type:complete len:334 (-) comp15018_c0_seq13:279-1280(-)